MAKAIVCIGATFINGTEPSIGYSVTVIGPPTYSYGSDYTINTAQSLNNNLIAWRNKVIAQAQEKGVTLLSTDIIVFGAPS